MAKDSKKKSEKDEVGNLQQQADEYLDGWKRCKADFENYKKQQQEWADSFRQYAAENLIQDIIPVVDNFELALDHIPQTPENKLWLEGILHIKKQLEVVLANQNVKIINAKKGDVFDPNMHECVEDQKETSEKDCETDSENSKKTPIIDKVLRNGYTIGSKLLRPVQVTIREA